MAYKGPDRRIEHMADGFAARSVAERTPVDELDYRKTGEKPDTIEEVAALRAAGKETLLRLAGHTTEKVATTPTEALSPEQIEAQWLAEFKTRFDAMPSLHEGVVFDDVEKALRKDVEAMRLFQKWDRLGHSVNCYGFDKEAGELIFASAWTDVTKVAPRHRNIVLDGEAEAWLNRRFPKEVCNGNAVDIARQMGGQLAGREINEKLHQFIANGWAYVDTPPNIRDIGREDGNPNDNPGSALYGRASGVRMCRADRHAGAGSLRAARRVKKA